MLKSNVINVDFRPQVRGTGIEQLNAELDVIDVALAAAHVSARELAAKILRAEGALESLLKCDAPPTRHELGERGPSRSRPTSGQR